MGKVTLYPLYKQVAQDIANQFKPGDLITMKWLENALDVYPPVGATTTKEVKEYEALWLSVIEGLKQALLVEHNIFINNEWGKGYKWIPAGQQAPVAMKKLYKKLSAETNKATTVVAYTDFSALTSDEVKQSELIAGQLHTLKKMHNKVFLSNPRGPQNENKMIEEQ